VELPPNNEATVVFHEPMSISISSVGLWVVVTMVLGTTTAFSMWFLIGYLNWPQGAPVWWFVISCAATLSVIVGIWLVFWKRFRRRVCLDELGVEVGSLTHRRRYAYEELNIVRIEPPSKPEHRCRELVLERKTGRPFRLLLSVNDAAECFHALRLLAPQLIGVDHGTIYGPLAQNDSDSRAARIALSEAKRQVRKLLLYTFACVCGSGAAIMAIFNPGSSPMMAVKLWAIAVVLPIAAVVCFVRYSKLQLQIKLGHYDSKNGWRDGNQADRDT
jgi:hypothetical protein